MNIQTSTLRGVLKQYREYHEGVLKKTECDKDRHFLSGFIAALKQVEGNILKSLENDMKDIIQEHDDAAEDRVEYIEACAKYGTLGGMN